MARLKREALQLAVKESVTSNVAESKAARSASNFSKYAEAERQIASSSESIGAVNESGKDVALGLRVNRQGENILEPFAKEVNAVPNGRWHIEGLADLDRPFVQRFYQAAYRSTSNGGKLKFNLDYLNLNRALETKRFSDPFEVGVTNWELQQVLHNKSFYKNTEFYIGKQRLTNQDVLDFGLGFRGK